MFYTGVINSVGDKMCVVSHLIRSGKDNWSWVFPEDSDVQNVSAEQILYSDITVQYHHSTRIRCTINKSLASEIDGLLEQFQESR